MRVSHTSVIVAWARIVDGAGTLERLTAIEEEGIVHAEAIAQTRASIGRGHMGIKLRLIIPKALRDVGLEEADFIEEVAILQSNDPGLLGILIGVASSVRRRIQAYHLRNPVP